MFEIAALRQITFLVALSPCGNCGAFLFRYLDIGGDLLYLCFVDLRTNLCIHIHGITLVHGLKSLDRSGDEYPQDAVLYKLHFQP